MAKKAVKKTVKKSAKKKAAAPRAKKAGTISKADLSTEGMKKPDGDYLNKLLSRLETLSITANSAAGDISAAIDKAYEQKGVDKAALSILRRLRDMPVKKAQTTVPHLLLYIQLDTKLQKNLNDQSQIDFDGEDADKEGQTDLDARARRLAKKDAAKDKKKSDAKSAKSDDEKPHNVTTLRVTPRPQEVPKDDDSMGDIPASG